MQEKKSKDQQNKAWMCHPRPQMKRERVCILSEGWKLDGQEIRVPFPPQSKLSGFAGTIGDDFVYTCSFRIPEDFKQERILLHFGAVDQIATVEVNGTEAGSHEGGYLPFTFDITQLVDRTGENRMKVMVKDDLSLDYPYGKQSKNPQGMWYTPVSGIWQQVWLENVPQSYIKKIKITPTLAQISVEAECEGTVQKVSLEIVLPSGDKLREEMKVQDEKAQCTVPIPDPVLWTPEHPYLYDMKITAGEDVIESYFALRTMDIRQEQGVRRVCLNGEPVFLHGVLDQGYFLDGIFLPEQEEAYENDIKIMKELGFNLLRKHIKVEPEYFYYMCDRLGMLVMQDMVNNGEYSFLRDTALPTAGFKKRNDRRLNRSDKRRAIFKKHTEETIGHLYNHPCIVAYTVFNEGWGQFNSDEMYDFVKELDSTRLIDTTSGWYAHRKSDFDSEHIYFRLKKLKVKNRPLFVSECGGYKYMEKEHFFGKKEYGYGTCKSKEELTDRIVTMYEKMILPYIEDGVCGCIYTQLSDVEGEINGLYTYDRSVCKVDRERMREVARRIWQLKK
nr:glycoside hydrolase family 2 [Lachnospiraceae bacterium]